MKKIIKYIVMILIIIAILFIVIGLILKIRPLPTTDVKKATNKSLEDKITELSHNNVVAYRDEILKEIDYANANLYQNYPIKDVDKLSDEIKTRYVLDILTATSNEAQDVSAVVEEAKKHFETFNIYKKDIKDGKLVTYKYSDNSYTKGLSYIDGCFLYSDLSDFERSSGNWQVTSKVYYLKGMKDKADDPKYTINVYKTRNNCLDNKSSLLEVENENITLKESDYKKVKDKIGNINYNFKKISGRYLLKSVEFE